jgi:signal transduction histidine kinase
MKNNLSKLDYKKQELNCGVNAIPILTYLEELYGKKKMIEIVEPLGLPIPFLINKSNWISFDYYSLLLKKLVEITKDEKAPYKVPFSMSKPQAIVKDIFLASYASIFLGSPKNIYKLIFGKNIYKRYTKIGDFYIKSYSRNSITVEYKLFDGYKQNKYNCLAIQGYMAVGTLGCGLPPAEVVHEHCAAEGKDSCIYIIKWEKRKRSKTYLWLLFFLSAISTEIFLYNSVFDIKDIIITSIGIISLLLAAKNIQYMTRTKQSELFNYERNNSVLDAMEKIEKDYNEILNTKIKLEARNRYLTIVNNINKSIVEENIFESLTRKVGEILITDIGFIECLYFNINFKKNIFTLQFDMFRKNKSKIYYKNLDNINFNISINDYSKLEKMGFKINDTKLYNSINNNSSEIKNWLKKNKNIYYLPIEVPGIYTGFYLLLGELKLEISHEFIKLLLQNISGLLKVAYLKIYSKYVIENILSSIPAIVLIFTIENYEIRYVNNMFFTSYPKNENIKTGSDVVGNNLFSTLAFDETSIENVSKIIDDLLIGKKGEINEINIGSMVFEYSLFTIPQYMEGGENPLIGIILTDVTEAKYFQQKLLINEKLLALGRVASGIAHEINNPLYGVLANAEDIADNENLDPETKKNAKEMVEHIMHISHVIKDLSSYSKTLRKESYSNVDINKVIDESLILVKYSFNFADIDIIKKTYSLPTIKASKGEIQQIFINLFNNAIHAMDGEGELTIETKYKNNNIIIKITDTGKGIPEENIPYIFNLFFTTKNPDEGTGQGLHIVKKIVKMYNGKIDVKSKIGVGTTFIVKFKI